MTAAKNINPRSERGQTMVEFALAMPVLCLVLFGIIQFGILFNDYLSLTDATRVGARKGAVSRTAPSPAAVTEAAVRNAASDLSPGSLDVDVIATSWTAGGELTVEATYPYDVNVFGVVVASGLLKSSITERIE
jgi:Flp pilus assembly protein TadG